MTEQQDLKVQQDHKVLKEKWVKMDRQDLKEPMVPQVHKVLKAQQEIKALKVFKEHRV